MSQTQVQTITWKIAAVETGSDVLPPVAPPLERDLR